MPCPSPQFLLSKDRSRSRLAVSENIERDRSSRLLLTCASSASGEIAPEWQESVSNTFDFAFIFDPATDPRVSIGYPVAPTFDGSTSYGARYARAPLMNPCPAK